MLRERRNVYTGKIVGLTVDVIELSGQNYIREVVHHPGGVVVLAESAEGRIPFVRQLRYPMQKVLLELPAGKLDAGEDPRVCAARELEEETGFRAKSLEHIFSFYPSPGFCDELLHLYYTNCVEKTHLKLEHDEEISVEFHTLEEAIDLSLRREILDAKTLLALFWLRWKKQT